VTEPFLGAPSAPPEAAGTTVSLFSAALVANARSARRAADGTDALAADAWGHGVAWVTGVLEARGLSADRIAELSGVDLYGLPGSEDARPVMRLSGRVLSTKDLRAGEGVSYGYTFTAEHDTRVALVTGGYAQGVVRSLGNRAVVLIDGTRCPIIGRVAMDVSVVDIRDLPVERGAVAVHFGDPSRDEPSLDEWVRATAYGAAEIVAAVGLHANRVPE